MKRVLQQQIGFEGMLYYSKEIVLQSLENKELAAEFVLAMDSGRSAFQVAEG